MKYFCHTCAYNCTNKSNLNKHLKSTKHKNKSIDVDINEKVLCKYTSVLRSTLQGSTFEDPEHVKSSSNSIVLFKNERAESYGTFSSNDHSSMINTESPNKNKNTINPIRRKSCEICKREFNTSSNFYRHRKRCLEKTEKTGNKIALENVILREKIKNERKIREILEKKIEHLETDKEFSKKIMNKSMSALNYVMKNLNDAPTLKTLPHDEIKTMLDYGDKTDFFMIESVIFAYKEDYVIKLLGDALLKYYKKDNPKEQSLWNTDITRLTYIIRLSIHDENDWVVDKQGVRTNKIIIEPFLFYICDKTRFVVKNFNKFDKTLSMNEIEFLKYSSKFINDIENGRIKDDVIKYIAPFLTLEKI
jgi:hypothetical protein